MPTVHILNGESLKEYLESKNVTKELLLAVNEVFMEGEMTLDILSESFIEKRQTYLTEIFNVPMTWVKEKYQDLIALTEVRPPKFTLWFDDDMFCQLNMLVILAYLDQMNFQGGVVINIIPKDFFSFSAIENLPKIQIKLDHLDHFYDLYAQVLVHRNFLDLDHSEYQDLFQKLPCLKMGLELYRSYQQTENEINTYIIKHQHQNKDQLIEELLQVFSCYGLGDWQYINLMKSLL